MNSTPNVLTKPIDIARIALRRLTELKMPPTPENYVREYRHVAGLPVDDAAMARPWAGGEETVGMVRAIMPSWGWRSHPLISELRDRSRVDSRLSPRRSRALRAPGAH